MSVETMHSQGNAAATTRQGLVLLGMPSWDVSKPFHALAVVAGIAREAGAPIHVYDVNVDFFRQVSPEEQKYWQEDFNHLWTSAALPDELWSKYRPWLTGYLDRVLQTHDPRLLAFSVNMSTRAFSIAAAQYVKTVRPELPILFGGVDCFPKEYNKRFLETENDRYCDIICQGEAELSLVSYLRDLMATGDWQARGPGFAFRKGDTVVDTGDTELPTLKERQPTPAYDLFDLSKYTQPGSLPFFLTRGCVYNCHFCSEKPNFKRFRYRAAEEAVAELETVLPFAQPYHARPTFSLADSNLNANMKLLEQFVDLILEKGIQIQWGGQAHIQRQMTSALIEKLARSGFVSVFWGIESGSQHVVDLMNKRYRQSDARRILRDCSRVGIQQHIPIILGFPGETPEDVAETVHFILEFKDLPHCHVHLPCQIVVRPNSPLHTNYVEFQLANNSYYEWCTRDGTNSLPIRIARRFVARQAHGNPALSMEHLVDSEEILQIRLNDPHTAADLYRLVHEVFRRGQNLAQFYQILEGWTTDAGLLAAAVESPQAGYRAVWEAHDKDSPEGRREVYGTILEGLRALRQRPLEELASDCDGELLRLAG